MTWALSDSGPYATSSFNTSVTPTLTGSWNPGDLGAIVACALPVPATPNTPVGWTSINVQTGTSNSIWLYFRLLQLGDAIPAVTWATSQSGVAACAAAFSGAPSTLTAIVDHESDAGINSTINLSSTGTSFVPTNNNCLLIYASVRGKTTASDATVFTMPTNFTQIAQYAHSGNSTAGAFAHWIQTTATSSAGAGATGTVADATTQAARAFRIALIPGVIAPNALLGWAKQTFVTETLIQV